MNYFMCFCFVILFSLLLMLTGDHFNVAWLISLFLLWKCFDGETSGYTIPAGLFAIAGCISSFGMKYKIIHKKDEDSMNGEKKEDA